MAERFDMQASNEGDRYTLALRGELDLVSADALEEKAREICSGGAAELLIDLSNLAFMDSRGLRAILQARSICEEGGCAFWLTPGPEAIQNLFELTGLLEVLPFKSI